MSRCIAAWTTLACLVSASAFAQVDNRVQPRQPLPGHALDASNQVGSGGFNNPRADANYGTNANAIISGNVTGLGGFRSSSAGLSGLSNPFNVTGINSFGNSSGLLDSSSFLGSLPSNDISFFNRRSYSVSDTLQYGLQPGQSQTYFGGTDTVLNVGALRRGLNRPGAGSLANPYVPLNTPTAGLGASPGLPTGVRDAIDRRIRAPSLADQPILGVQQNPLALDSAGFIPNYQRPYLGAIESSLFGPSGGDVRLSPALALKRYRAVVGGDLPSDSATYDTAFAEQRRQREALAAAPIRGNNAQPTPTPLPGPGAWNQQTPTAPRKPGDVGAPTDALSAATLGQDRFADLARAVQEARRVEPEYLSALRGGAGVEQPSRGDSAAPSGGAKSNAATMPPSPVLPSAQEPRPETLQFRRRDFLDRLEQASRVAKDLLERPVKTFAGTSGSSFDRYMTSAEASLRSGDYYAAAGQFGLASRLDPVNPLPLLGRGHALAAAGDYISATHFLTAGIAKFPDIVAFDLDLVSLLGRKDVFDLRRADLEKQLAASDSPELRFVLGYLEYYSGLRDLGLANLKAAAAKCPSDSVIAQFPELLTGKKPNAPQPKAPGPR